jgi:hypothetical protein
MNASPRHSVVMMTRFCNQIQNNEFDQPFANFVRVRIEMLGK